MGSSKSKPTTKSKGSSNSSNSTSITSPPIMSDPNKQVSIGSNIYVGQMKSSPDADYSKVQFLGEGSFATVYKVKHKITSAIRAMKVIKKNSHYSKDDEIEIMNEINILKKMDHPSILKIFEYYSSKDTHHLVTEMCNGGELFNEIIEHGPFNEKFSSYLMYQILSAVNYCHKMCIVHRDLKPENILIEKREKNGYLRIKVCDFGTSKMFEKGVQQKKIVGSSYYIAPEVLGKKYDEKCDMWSCGVILYILLTSRPPFAGDNDDQIISRVKGGKYDMSLSPWDKISSEAKDLVKNLLQIDSTKRLSAEQALSHPWIIKNESKELFNEIKTTGQVARFIENLKTYKNKYILQETALAYLVHNNPQMEEIENACKLFNQMDVNGDGKISKQELYAGLSRHFPNNELLLKDCDEIFKNIDGDNNGYLEYEEFVRAAIDKSMFLDEHFLKFAFRYFDKDNSGEITLEEIEEVFADSITTKGNYNAQLKKILAEVDLNGDGIISFEEFATIMKNILEN